MGPSSPADGAGRRGRVVVGVSGSPGSVTALYRAVAEARLRGAELWPVLVREPLAEGAAYCRVPAAATLARLDREAGRRARERLLGIVEDVCGPEGPGVPAYAAVVRGVPGPALVAAAADAVDGADLLVLGAGRRTHLLHRSVTRYCVAHAPCPVLAVPPSPLAELLVAAPAGVRPADLGGLRD